MKLIHTSPVEINKINALGIAGDCLFFSGEAYKMTASSTVYTYSIEIDEEKVIEASELHDEEIISEVAELFGVDSDMAESLLDGSESEWEVEGCDAEKSWSLQGLRGECAKKMGYEACEDEDEQGTVWIISMSGREGDLFLEGIEG